jgi:low affinity Fe/Cu permease
VQQAGGFNRFARFAAQMSGHPVAFLLASLMVVGWALVGPVCGFSDAWQLAINTATTIATFLMVFLIQNSQNRDSAAMQVKLNELIRAVSGAHNALLDLEERDQGDLERIRGAYATLADDARKRVQEGQGDTDSPSLVP